MYLKNSLKLVLTKRSITVSSLSPVLALQRQKRQVHSDLKLKIPLYCFTQVLFCTLYGLKIFDIYVIQCQKMMSTISESSKILAMKNPSAENLNVSMLKSPHAEKAATHLVLNPFDPQTSGPPLPVPMDKWSPKIQFPWTNGPQPIWCPWTNVLKNLVPLEKWSPTNLVPLFPDPHSLSSWTNKIFKEPFVQVDQIGWGLNFWGPFVHGD